MAEYVFGDGFMVIDVSLHERILHRLQILLQAFLFIYGNIHPGGHQISCLLFIVAYKFFNALSFFRKEKIF